MVDLRKIDLHIHTTVSDGTDSPAEIIERVKKAGITLFSVTDHDAFEGCVAVSKNLHTGDPCFIFGAEFSCEDELGKYHILGYGYEPSAASIKEIVKRGRDLRSDKLNARLDFLKEQFGFEFSKEDKKALAALKNPGKPHIGNLMVKYGYAATKEDAIENYIDKMTNKEKHISPKDAISAIIDAGGIPVLAHPSYGRGDELIIGDEMDERLNRLVSFGLEGVEAFYSGFTSPLQKEMLAFAEKYDLFVTAGSDYHGNNKLVMLGDTNLTGVDNYPQGMTDFLENVKIIDSDNSIKQ